MATSSMEAPLTSSSSPTYSSQSSSSLGLSPMLMSAAAAVAAHANQQNHMQQQQHQQQQVQYRVVPLPQDLGWVDLDFGCSTVCSILPRLIGIWQKWLCSCSWARWWNIQNKVNPTHVSDHQPHTVYLLGELGENERTAIRPCQLFPFPRLKLTGGLSGIHCENASHL